MRAIPHDSEHSIASLPPGGRKINPSRPTRPPPRSSAKKPSRAPLPRSAPEAQQYHVRTGGAAYPHIRVQFAGTNAARRLRLLVSPRIPSLLPYSHVPAPEAQQHHLRAGTPHLPTSECKLPALTPSASLSTSNFIGPSTPSLSRIPAPEAQQYQLASISAAPLLCGSAGGATSPHRRLPNVTQHHLRVELLPE